MESPKLTLPQTAPRRQALRVAVQMMALARRFLARTYRAQRDTSHLTRFNDHMLKDIGIVRSEIDPDVQREQSVPWR